MVVIISKNFSSEEIKKALDQFVKKQKNIKGYPDLDQFFGTIQERDWIKIQKEMRD